MIPLVDIHCHILPAIDDGPRSWDDALSMCRIAWNDGVRAVAATVHQNEQWPGVTPDLIRTTAAELSQRLRAERIPLVIYPGAEVMINPAIELDLQAGRLLTLADGGQYLLVELPHRIFVDLREFVSQLVRRGVRPILAHPERHPELLYGKGVIEELIQRGCLVQVSASSITEAGQTRFSAAIKSWALRGVIHLLGSDGHSPTSRLPQVAAAYQILARWCGPGPADRICSANGLAVLEGLPLVTPQPRAVEQGWFRTARTLGGRT